MGVRKKVNFAVDASGCFICSGHASRVQYHGRTLPFIWRERRSQPMQEWLYKEMFGPLPAGFTVLLKCENDNCINPEHFRPAPLITRREREAREREQTTA